MSLAKERGGRFRLAELQVRLGKEEPDLAQAVGRGAKLQEPLAYHDCILHTALGDRRLELDQPGLRLVGAAALVREEELDRLSGPARDVLEGW